MPPLALLAGGLATRLRPLTETIPKSLVNIADEPFIGHQLRLLTREGVTEIVICTGHLGERIEAYVGDGSRWGCHVRYSADGDRPLGTGGALRRALPLLGERFFVMYGDSYLNMHFRTVYEAFCRSGLPALMTVFRNEGRWDGSNVEFADGVIRSYDKAERTPAMRHIDYGLGGFEAHVVRACPANTPLRSGGSLSRPCPTAVARGLRGASTFLRDWFASRAGGNGRVFTARLGSQGRGLAVTYWDGRGR